MAKTISIFSLTTALTCCQAIATPSTTQAGAQVSAEPLSQLWLILTLAALTGSASLLTLGLSFLAKVKKSIALAVNVLLLLTLTLFAISSSNLAVDYFWPNAPLSQYYVSGFFAYLSLMAFALQSSHYLNRIFYPERYIKLFYTAAVSALVMALFSVFLPVAVNAYMLAALAITNLGGYVLIMLEQRDIGRLTYSLSLLAVVTLALTVSLVTGQAPLELSQLLLAIQIVAALLFSVNHYLISCSETSTDSDKDLQLSEQMLELQLALKELEEKNELLERLNTLDELSGIHNRRHFDKRLLAELRRCRRELTPISLIMFDIDHFKRFNDNYGHLAGDQVIRAVALTASEQLNREADEIFRYGGEEYAIVLPNTEPQGAQHIAEQIRIAIEQLVVTCAGKPLDCTISLGVACHLSQQAIDPTQLIERADSALYQAKQNGRNQVALYNE